MVVHAYIPEVRRLIFKGHKFKANLNQSQEAKYKKGG